MYFNGVAVASANDAQNYSGTTLVFGGYSPTVERFLGSILSWRLTKSSVSVSEAMDRYLRPWAGLQPRRLYIPTASAAATVPTLSASTYVPGSLTSTGWRPQITAS
jgi:hypothetical protein